MYRSSVLVAAIAAWTIAGIEPADAQRLFSKGNQPHLCRTVGDTRLVDKLTIARKLVEPLQIPLDLLDRANPDGTPNPSNPNAPLYAISSKYPFGKKATYSNEEEKYARALRTARGELSEYLENAGPAMEKEGYFVTGGGGERPSALQFFTQDSVNIECRTEAKGPKEPKKQADGPKLNTDTITKRILLRRNENELKIARRDIKESNSALVSFTHDARANDDIVNIDGALGFIVHEFGVPETANHVGTIVSYVRAKRFTGKNEVNFIKPGLQANVLSDFGPVTARTTFDGSGTFDERFDSRQYVFAASFAPTLGLAPNFILFGGLLPPIGPLQLRPDLLIKASGQYIEEFGTNPALKGKQSYFSYGGILSTDVFVDLPMFSGFRGSVAYSMFDSTEGIPDVRRLDARLVYAFPGNENVTLNLEYARGREPDTLVMEDKWMAGIGVRY